MAAMPRCPICGKAAGSRPKNPHGPFCSLRCKQLDLGRWLGGAYLIAGEALGRDDGAEPLRDEEIHGDRGEREAK